MKLTANVLNSKIQYTFGNEIEYLRELGTQLKPGSLVVMLGVGPAIMALALLEEADPDILFLGFDNHQPTIWFAEEHVKAAQLKQFVTFMLADSAEAVKHVEAKVDLLLVDADHSYEAVKRDIQAWWPHLKNKGLVLFHDYIKTNDDINGVEEAVNDCKDETWVEIDRPGISIVFQKELGHGFE